MKNIQTPHSGSRGDMVAVMDLGTNTFHLLIAEGHIANFQTIVHEHIAVKLGEGGINKGVILPAAYQRGIDTMCQFKQQIDREQVKEIRAIATSALRNALNGNEFIEQVKDETGIEIEIIDGNREASFIYEGVKATGLLSSQNSLIMDIGGGSVEFIIANRNGILWKQSFEIGAARLMERFHHTDPIPAASIEALDLYLENALTDLFAAVKNTPVYQLIGSSGAFETFAELSAMRRSDDFDLSQIKSYEFDYQDLLSVTEEMIGTSHAEREANTAIVPVRVDMIVVSSVITRFIMQRFGIRNVSLCTYSLKEGVLAEMLS